MYDLLRLQFLFSNSQQPEKVWIWLVGVTVCEFVSDLEIRSSMTRKITKTGMN